MNDNKITKEYNKQFYEDKSAGSHGDKQMDEFMERLVNSDSIQYTRGFEEGYKKAIANRFNIKQVSLQCAREASFELGKEEATKEFLEDEIKFNRDFATKFIENLSVSALEELELRNLKLRYKQEMTK